MKDKYSLVSLFKIARKQIKEKKMQEAKISFESGIILLSNMRNPESKDEDILEGTKRALWYERFWSGLENNNLMD